MNKNSDVYLIKEEIDENGNIIYKEYSNGYQVKFGYYLNNDLMYEENSENGIVFDVRYLSSY